MTKQSRIFLTQFSNLIDGKLCLDINLREAEDLVKWFLDEHRAFFKLSNNDSVYLTPNGYVESLEHILCLQDLAPSDYLLTEHCVSIFMDEIKKFLKNQTGKDNQKIELTIIADGVAIQEVS